MGDLRAAASRRSLWLAAAIGLLLAVGLIGPAPAASPGAASSVAAQGVTWKQGQRVVVTVERDGSARVSRGLPLAAAAVPASEPASARIAVNRDQDAVRLLFTAPGGATYRQTIAVERYIRGEFPGANGEIEGHRIPVSRYTFAATLPYLGPGSTLRATLVTRTRTVSGDRVAVRAPSARRTPGAAARLTGFPSGPARNRVDLVLMGDGYTKAQKKAFRADAKAAADELFATHPYSTYKRYFNVVTVFKPSQQSGADEPRYQSGCDAGTTHPIACCPDPSAGGASVYRATRYNSSYCYYGIDRLLVPMRSNRLMNDATKAYPRWDHLVVIVNDDKYGGSGGAIATTSTNPSGIEVVKHELGHSLMNLADEYSDAAAYPPCSDRKRGGVTTKCQPNVTDVTSRRKLKWREWVKRSTPIPTSSPRSPDVVGLFEGAYYSPDTYYRSCDSCIMRALGTPFGAVAAEQMPVSLYRRFDISLADARRPERSSLAVDSGDQRRFKVRVLAPSGAKVRVVWLVDGKKKQSGSYAKGDWASFRYRIPNNREHTVVVKVREKPGTLHARNVAVSQTRQTWRLR